MADVHDSCSMTPPMSPSLAFPMDGIDFSEDMDIPDKDIEPAGPVYPCFQCRGEAILEPEFHRQGPLCSGALERLLRKNSVAPRELNSQTVELLGFQFLQTALGEQMDTLFYMLRNVIGRLDDLGISVDISDDGNCGYMALRTEILHFFDYILTYLECCLPQDMSMRQTLLCSLMQQLKHLLLVVGPLHQLAPHVFHAASSRGMQSSSRGHHLFHTYLDIYWSILELLYSIQAYHGGISSVDVVLYRHDGDDAGDLFQQVATLLLWDVTILAINTHNNMSSARPQSSPFPCGCVQELLTLLAGLMEDRQNKLAKKSFWVSMNPVMEKVLNHQHILNESDTEYVERVSTEFVMPPEFQCQQPVAFCWWYLSHLAPLLKPSETKQISNYYLVQVLLKVVLPSGSTTEMQMRAYLRSLLQITTHWQPSLDTQILLWDHFYRRLNDSFQLVSGSLQGFASLNTSVQGWLDEIRSRCRGDEDRLSQDNSFQLFLRFLSHQITMATPAGSLWRQMKGRFYSKFHGRRLQELTDVGLQNFTSLFLTLAYTTQLEDVSAKLCDLYGTLSPVKLEFSRRLVLWRGLFALTMLYVERGVDCAVIADSLAQELNKVTGELSLAGISADRYHSLWKLMHVYLEGMQDVIQASPRLILNEHKLIGSGFRELIGSCRENELRMLLTTVQSILTKHRVVYKRFGGDVTHPSHVQHRGLSDSLWMNFYEFVRCHAATLTPPPQLADVAAGFTMLVLDLPPSIHSGMKADFLTCFQYYAWGEQVAASVSCRFLCHLMSNQAAMEQLAEKLTNHELCLIQAWFRCCWQLVVNGNNEMQELTRLVLKLPYMSRLLNETSILPGEGCGETVLAFIKALGRSYAQVTDLQGKISFQSEVKQLLGEIPKFMAPVLKALQPPEVLNAVFNLAGHLVKHCASFLYIKSRPDCLLPVLMDRLVLPRQLLHTNRQVAPALISAIGKHLHLFVAGLGQLDYRRDPYVQRKLRDVLHQHFPRFPIKSTFTVTDNPFVASFRDSFVMSPPEEIMAYRCHLMELIKLQYLKMQGSLVPSTAHQSLTVITEVLHRTKNPQVITRDGAVLLGVCLQYQLLCDQSSVRQLATRAVQTFMEAAAHCPEVLEGPAYLRIVEEFFNSHLALHQGRVFKVLESGACLAPSIFTPLIPALTTGVKASENKRGVGIDKHLRLSYCTLLQHLGSRGQEEKRQLLLEAST